MFSRVRIVVLETSGNWNSVYSSLPFCSRGALEMSSFTGPLTGCDSEGITRTRDD